MATNLDRSAASSRSSLSSSNSSDRTYSVTNPIKILRQLVINNIEHYQRAKGSYAERFYVAFCLIEQETDAIQPALESIEGIAPEFDFDPAIPGNGYRSLVKVVDSCINRLTQISRYISINRDGLLFRSSHYCREIEAFGKVLSQLRVVLCYAQKLLGFSDLGQLFPDMTALEQIPQDMMLEIQALDRECFYGRCLGFQFCECVQQPVKCFVVALASYGKGYVNYKNPIPRAMSSLVHGSRYLTNPEARAKQVVSVTNHSNVEFCKAFWGITEGDVIAEMCNLMAGSVAINKLIQIQPHNFELEAVDGSEMVTIVPPCAHTGPAPVQIRLICFVEREGQAWLNDPTTPSTNDSEKKAPEQPPSPMSRGLLIHIHGGGFVAHTSKSHEIYLRSWARDLGVPIVSIDYSLAPEQPFPRAFEECFFAYAWAIKNAPYLGSTGEHICLVGDSAGGNLATAVAMRASSYGIRPPDGVVPIYTPFRVHYIPSPSRMMSLLDPLLPIGILIRCLSAYAGVEDEVLSDELAQAIIQKANDKLHRSQPPPPESDSSEERFEADDDDDEDDDDDDDLNENNTLPLEWDDSASVHTGSEQISVNGSILSGHHGMSQADSPIMESVDMTKLDLGDVELATEHGVLTTSTTSAMSNHVKHGHNGSARHETIALVDPCDIPRPSSPRIDAGTNHHPSMYTLETMHGDMNSHTDISLDSPEHHHHHNSNKKPLLKDNLHLDLSSAGKGSKVRDEGVQSPSYVTSPIRRFREVPIMKNSYMSPLIATDELLKGLPPVHVIACALDPLLDDSITFAKRLRSLNKPVSLEVIDKLPHGFLNFSLVGKECKAASMVVVQHIMQVLYGSHQNSDDEFTHLE